MNRLLPAVFLAQKILLVLSFHFHRLFTATARRDSVNWVVGTTEIASMIHQIAGALPGSLSVSFVANPYYSFRYDIMPNRGKSARTRAYRHIVRGPILLGRLMVQARGFVFVGANGFLFEGVDEREFEFHFLKKHGRKIATYWCGSEIRSPRLMHELERETGLPNIFSYIGQILPSYETEAHERMLRKRADVANRFADVMFDAPTDQRSYLTGHREPFFLFMTPERFGDNPHKFDDLSHIVVAHASSSPIIKGTPLVRAAVAKLKSEGYDFEYVELIGVDNDHIARELDRTHIALNQFYGFTTGVFSAESHAARCAVLSSADETIETSLAPGANSVSMVTKHWQVYDHLKELLDNPDRIEPLANSGQEWARKFVSTEQTGRVLQGILGAVLSGVYRREDRAALSNEELYGLRPERSGEGETA